MFEKITRTVKTFTSTKTRTMTDGESKAFDKAFQHMDKAFDSMNDAFKEMNEAFKAGPKEGELVIEETDGNVVIKGPVKTLVVNGRPYTLE